MTTLDISRHLFQPTRHYSGLRMQQGRPILDVDLGEREMIDADDRRLALTDVIGPHGSADGGFRIEAPKLIEPYDFTIREGSYYIGGRRLQLDQEETFRAQADWLQSSRLGVSLPQLPDELRDDLVYMIAWEQEVSAVEDQEFVEQALGGPDAGVRIRRMRRVQVKEGLSADRSEAIAELKAAFTEDGHTFDERSGEFLSATRLRVEPANSGPVGDLCQPPAITGYLGAENQAIRVQMIARDRFLWSYDNASPLYRIDLPDVDEPGVYRLTFLTLPRDQAHYPQVGQVVELLPWGARLGEGVYAADHPIAPEVGGGVYGRVKQPYDPKTRTLTVELTAAELDPIVQWYGAQDDAPYLYLRHWNPGDNGTGEIGVPFVLGLPVELAGSGLQVTIRGADGVVGDHWIIAARPATPAIPVPWDLQDDAAPHGPRRFIAPLALLHWYLVDRVLGVTAESCRRTFRPLTEQNGCCTVTVGDGDQSFGDYRTITEALAALPAAGGKVCVLAGIYEERIVLDGRSDIVLEGCCDRTIIRTPDDNDTSAGLITLTGCARITLRSLTIEATAQIGVMLMPNVAGGQGPITLEDLTITSQRDPDQVSDPTDLWLTTSPALFPCPTIAADQIAGLEICRCTLTMVSHRSAMPNVLLGHVLGGIVRDCAITTTLAESETVHKAWGGLLLGAACQHVEVLHNEIKGGMGHGITLGSVAYVDFVSSTFADIFSVGTHSVIEGGMTSPGLTGWIDDTATPPGGGDPVDTLAGTELNHISIVDNYIHDMSTSGISVLAFWAEPADLDNFTMIAVSDLLIDHNRIVDNYQLPAETPISAADLLDVVAFGGITLAAADDLRVLDNTILDNGLDHIRPVCGVFVLHGENIDIERNLIKRNGERTSGAGEPGVRAGIALQMAGRRVYFDGAGGLDDVDDDNLDPAARVRGNTILQPVGRSLQLYGLGPMVVEGNHLVNGGLTALSPGNIEAHAVEIINLGQSPELVADGAMPSFFGFLPAPPIQGNPSFLDERLVDGRILYADNQLRLRVMGADATGIHCAVRLLSHGDVMMQGNQHVTSLDRDVGSMTFSTTAIGWSVNVSENRSEDTHLDNSDFVMTDVSIVTTAALNITALNIATRCILAFDVDPAVGTTPNIHDVYNIVYYDDADCATIASHIVYWLTFTT